MSKQYKVTDWSGRDLTSHFGYFDEFDDAWEAIYEFVRDELGEDADDETFSEYCGEYYVVEVKGKELEAALADKNLRECIRSAIVFR